MPASSSTAPVQGRAARDLGECEIDLWSIPLPDNLCPGEFARRVALLSSSERVEAEPGLRRRQIEFVVTRSTIREILGRIVRQKPADLVFDFAPSGKPRLADSTVQFSVAHTSGLALLAVSAAAEIGVDLEQLRPIPEAREIAAQFFSPDDRAEIERASPAHQPAAFLRRWTAGEALLKARGRGLDQLHLLRECDLGAISDAGEIAVRLGREATLWLRAFRPAAGYLGAIAAARPRLRLRQRLVAEFSLEAR